MAPKTDAPELILRLTERGIAPHMPLDGETLAGLRIGTQLSARVLKEPPSPGLRAWWMLCSAVVKANPELISKDAVSHHILRSLNLVYEERLIGGSRKEPMSLKDFDEAQLKRLLEMGKLVVYTDLIPGVDIEALLDNVKRR